MEQELENKIEELANVMFDMGIEKQQAIALVLLANKEGFLDELLSWLKEHPNATTEEAFIFADTQY